MINSNFNIDVKFFYMELKEFVKTVLTEISAGVADAKKELGASVIVNPMPKSQDALKPITEVRFEIGLTSSDAKGSATGIGVFLGSIGVGTKNDAMTNSELITRIGFAIPIAFPFTRF